MTVSHGSIHQNFSCMTCLHTEKARQPLLLSQTRVKTQSNTPALNQYPSTALHSQQMYNSSTHKTAPKSVNVKLTQFTGDVALSYYTITLHVFSFFFNAFILIQLVNFLSFPQSKLIKFRPLQELTQIVIAGPSVYLLLMQHVFDFNHLACLSGVIN